MTLTDAFDRYLEWASARRRLSLQLSALGQPDPRWWEPNAVLKMRLAMAKKGRRS